MNFLLIEITYLVHAMLRKRSLLLGLITPLLYASLLSSAGATVLCPDMQMLVSRAETNFLEHSQANSGLRQPEPLPAADSCSMAIAQSGANTFHCAWKFSYREDSARLLFEDFQKQLQSCFNSPPQLLKDPDVNHPDSFDLHQYQLQDVVVTLSLKDKSVLRHTFIFIGVQGVK